MKQRTYLSIDLKSFYASVECVERGLDPLTTKLVVADESRTEKTICLAVTPALKAYGLSGRSRLFEVIEKAKEVKRTTGKELEYIVAVPRMALYIKYSTEIYKIYLKYVSADDIHVYSIDEVFIDVTNYLDLYNLSGRELAKTIIKDVYDTTGITATAGIGTNLYLAKVAMDIVAKHVPADADGVRIAQLDEISYREQLWEHTPLTDFWRIGHGTVDRLEKYAMKTLGDVAEISIKNPELLYKIFGIDAEILIDHVWGYEPVTIKDIKNYKPQAKSVNFGQVLMSPYNYEETKIVVREMCQAIAMDLLDKGLVANSFTLHIGYDRVNIDKYNYNGAVKTNYYGKTVPVSRHGTATTDRYTYSAKKITAAVLKLFDQIYNKNLYSKRINLTANGMIEEGDNAQMDFFSIQTEHEDEKEKDIQKAILNLQKRFGKNAVLKGTDLQDGATTIERNSQIGGHKA